MEKKLEIQFIKFEVGGIVFCVPLEIIDEVFPAMKAVPVPHVDGNIDGIAILRGDLMTIIDLAKLLDLDHMIKEERVLAVTYKGNKIGLRVDIITGILLTTIYKDLTDIDEDENQEVEKDKEDIVFDEKYQAENYYDKYKDLTSGYVIIDNRKIIVLDHMKIIRKLIG